MKKVLLYSFCLLIITHSSTVFSQEKIDLTDSTSNFLNMSLEELMNVEIVSASRKSEKVFDAPVTSFVISKLSISFYAFSI